MRAIEKAAIDSGTVTGPELMERAGQGVVAAILAEWPDLAEPSGALPAPAGPRVVGRPAGAPEYADQGEGGAATHRAVVFCGPGNNGGDGFVVARLLKARGWEVEVFLLGDPERLPPDARANCLRWLDLGGITPHDSVAPDFAGRDGLVIDAVFGTGLSRPLSGVAWDFVRAMIREGVDVSVDVPSGYCADSGRFLCDNDPEGFDAPDPQLIVTFQRPRQGHMLDQLGRAGARLTVVDIGIGDFVPRRKRNPTGPGDPGIVGLTSATTVRRAEDKAPILSEGRPAPNKFSHGHAFIVGGGPGHGGAARLSARGSLRIGAGLATIGCPPGALAENAARLDAVMLREVRDAQALSETLKDVRINALCIGPALGTGPRESALVAAALAAGRATVLDADALTLVARDPALFAALHGACVLTPHGGEFARLFPDIAARLAAPALRGPAFSKVDAAREASARAGCTVLFKGPDTVISEPSGRAAVNAALRERAAPWLATAGSGDVLAGFITGLLARGYSPFDAACAAAWLHVEAARGFGPGLIAEDLPEELPRVFRALGR